MTKVQAGDKVKVHVVGKLKDGEEFYSTLNTKPVVFTLGKNKLIEGIDKTLIGM
jgi:FKBP-type peptidyl-prolyl cis-trans isomerase